MWVPGGQSNEKNRTVWAYTQATNDIGPRTPAALTLQEIIFSHFQGAIKPYLRLGRKEIAYQIQHSTIGDAIWTLRHHPTIKESLEHAHGSQPKT